MRLIRRYCDLLVAVLAGVAVMVISAHGDLFGPWFDISHEHGPWELDGLLSAGVAVIFASLWFSMRHARRLKHAAARSEALGRTLRYALAAAHDGIWDWDIKTGMVARNDRAATMLGKDPSACLGDEPGFLDLIHPDDRAEADEIRRRCKDGEISGFVMEVRYQLQSGDYSWMLSRGKVVEWDADGTPRRVVGTRTDLSELNQLKKAWGEAKAASRAKSEFLALMSHELRTPLNAIIGFATVVENQTFGPDSEKYAEYGADIRSAGEQLLAIVNDILDLGRIQAGGQPLDEGEVVLADVIEDVRRWVQALADEKSLDLRIDCVPGMAVCADATKIKRVLVNLLFNAIKFTDQSGAVRLNARCDETGRVVVDVADTGIGIPADQLESIFLKFHQVEAHRGRNHEGTGLGLAITKAIVEQHGGGISVTSVVDQGTTFTFTLPKERLINDGETARLGAAKVVVA